MLHFPMLLMFLILGCNVIMDGDSETKILNGLVEPLVTKNFQKDLFVVEVRGIEQDTVIASGLTSILIGWS